MVLTFIKVNKMYIFIIKEKFLKIKKILLKNLCT